MHLSRFRTALMQPQALTFPFLSLLVPTVTTFPQSHLHTVVEQRCFVPLPLRTETFGFPGPITTRGPNLVPGSSCMSSFRPRPLLMFISSPLNVDRRPAGTEPCARTQMPAGRLKELIVSFCGGSDPHRQRRRRTYYTIKFGGAGVEPVLCLTFASGHVTPLPCVGPRAHWGGWGMGCRPRRRGVPLRRPVSSTPSSVRRSSALDTGCALLRPPSSRSFLVPLRRNAGSSRQARQIGPPFENGAPGRARTSCLRFRKPPLCPDELREQSPRKAPGLARAYCGTAASAHYAHGVRTDGLLRDPDVVVYGEEFCEAPSRGELPGASFGRPWLCTPIRFPFAV